MSSQQLDNTQIRHEVAMSLWRRLGKLCADERDAQDLTQEEVASRLGVSRKAIIDLEAGRRNDFDLLAQYQDWLGFRARIVLEK